MMLCLAASYLSSLTPITMVMSSPLAGAEMMTFFAPALMCAAALSASVKRPVDSTTTSIPRAPQGKAAGSRSASTLIALPLTTIASFSALTSASRMPWIESYLSKWAKVSASVRSLTATISSAGLAIAARNALRPMRPNPLIPTLIVMNSSPNHFVLVGQFSFICENSTNLSVLLLKY